MCVGDQREFPTLTHDHGHRGFSCWRKRPPSRKSRGIGKRFFPRKVDSMTPSTHFQICCVVRVVTTVALFSMAVFLFRGYRSLLGDYELLWSLLGIVLLAFVGLYVSAWIFQAIVPVRCPKCGAAMQEYTDFTDSIKAPGFAPTYVERTLYAMGYRCPKCGAREFQGYV